MGAIKNKLAFLAVFMMISGLCGALCAQQVADEIKTEITKPNPAIAASDAAISRAILGRWQVSIGSENLELFLTSHNGFTLGELEGTYAVSSGEILLKGDNIEPTSYMVTLDKDTLTLSGGNLKTPLKFTRLQKSSDYVHSLFDLSWPSVKKKLYRIGFILGVIIAVKIFIAALRAISHFVIYSQAGPLKLLYRRRKNRAMTIHMLTLNVVKYAAYLLAVGFILTELGVNYTAYLASISILGLSIAFGAQGLVQDMVTGLLIIIEGQFDVGDMVDIPPHTGIVEVLGLRMTKLRNYEGQQIVVPNRAISAVSNYSNSDQDACVDISVKDQADADKAAELLNALGEQVKQQYSGVILDAPKVTDILSIDGQKVVRMHAGFWPKQQWVIDQQLVVRAKAVLAENSIELTDTAVSVFYHDPKQVEISTLGETLKKFANLGKRFHLDKE